MSTPCPECGCPAVVLESKTARRGTARRRRYACQGPLCGHRWTEWSTRAGEPLDGPPAEVKPHYPKRRQLEAELQQANGDPEARF